MNTRPYNIFALSVRLADDGTVREYRAHLATKEGRLVDVMDLSEEAKATIIVAVRDWLAHIDP